MMKEKIRITPHTVAQVDGPEGDFCRFVLDEQGDPALWKRFRGSFTSEKVSPDLFGKHLKAMKDWLREEYYVTANKTKNNNDDRAIESVQSEV